MKSPNQFRPIITLGHGRRNQHLPYRPNQDQAPAPRRVTGLDSPHPVADLRVASEILRQQGVLGLCKGLSPAILRHIFYTPIRIVGYEHLRNVVAGGDDISLAGKAFVGGFSGVIAQTVRVEGLKTLWKGFFPTWARLGPWQLVFWASYEEFRHIAGSSSF